MAINTAKKIKRVSYNQKEIPNGFDVSNVTATKNDVLGNKTFIDNYGNIHGGSIPIMSGGTYSSTTTLQTANKYVTSNIILNVPNTVRWLTPTIIRISGSGVVSLKFRRVEYKLGINWGDGSDRITVNAATTSQTVSHNYTASGIRDIVIFPDTKVNTNILINSDTAAYIFDSYMFGQSSNSIFSKYLEIYPGDSCAFYENALSYCVNLNTLDFSKNNSLIGVGSNYRTWVELPPSLCRYSTITNLVLGTSIKVLGNDCFNYTTCRNITIEDARTVGNDMSIITLRNSTSLPTTINGVILIQNGRISSYRTGTYWSSVSNKMYAY